ncbi:MAG: phosphate acyltransferase PlsX [Oscillospiraceae bacterium]|jgi:glycerol-3-phosphate acyltransferase PlsX|nr:phosphate acyltransferase PlsX [Oscillospiraceae bacterium]
MRIIVDAFGGDNAPLEILKGCHRAAEELQGVEITLTGSRETIEAVARQNNISLAGIKILEAPRIFEMEFEPTSILKENNDTSLAAGLKAMAAGQAEGFVSAGSTGALLVGATLITKRIRGVRRAAIAAVLPTPSKPFLLLDSGANSECTSEMLEHFALLGAVYSEKILGVEKPNVMLANIGTEPTKGDALRQETYKRLAANERIHFGGNIEARDIPNGGADVVVADGFTGNIILKLYEGLATSLFGMVKGAFKKNPVTMLGAVLASPGLLGLKKKMDYSEYGGAPLLGINGTVIKAHGSSDAKAIFNAIRQAKGCIENHIVDTVKENLGA